MGASETRKEDEVGRTRSDRSNEATLRRLERLGFTRTFVDAYRAMANDRTVGILAGSGALPGMLIEACRAGGREPFVIAFNGFTDPATVGNVRHEWVDIAAVGKTFRHLHDAGCEAVVLAGKLKRPSLSSLRPDARGFKVIAKVATAGGDDALLRVLIAEIESEGFQVLVANLDYSDYLGRIAFGKIVEDRKSTRLNSSH